MTAVKDHRAREIEGAEYGCARVRITHADLTAAATSEVVTWAALVAAHPSGAKSIPANAHVLEAGINIITPFSGGTVSAITIDLGDAGNDDELLAAVDVFTGASGITTKNGAYTLGTFESAYTAIVTAEAVGDNVVNLDAGAAELWIRYVAMTTDARVLD